MVPGCLSLHLPPLVSFNAVSVSWLQIYCSETGVLLKKLEAHLERSRSKSRERRKTGGAKVKLELPASVQSPPVVTLDDSVMDISAGDGVLQPVLNSTLLSPPAAVDDSVVIIGTGGDGGVGEDDEDILQLEVSESDLQIG